MRIKFVEATFIRGTAVDRGDVRDEEPTLAQALIASRRAVAVIEDAPVTAPAAPEQTAPAAPEQTATTGTETATTVVTSSKPRRRG